MYFHLNQIKSQVSMQLLLIKTLIDLFIILINMSENNQDYQNKNQQQIQQPKQEEELNQEEQKYFEQVLKNIDKMHIKLQQVRKNMMNDQPKDQNVQEIHKIAETLLQAKQNSQIVKKQNLSEDVGTTLQRNIVEIYSKNQLMKQKIQEMAKSLLQKNKKIAYYQQKYQKQVEKNKKLEQQLKSLKNKHTEPRVSNEVKVKVEELKKEKSKQRKIKNNVTANQNDDYDFWNADPTQNFKKKKDIVEDSGLWINQKSNSDNKAVYNTQDLKKKR